MKHKIPLMTMTNTTALSGDEYKLWVNHNN